MSEKAQSEQTNIEDTQTESAQHVNIALHCNAETNVLAATITDTENTQVVDLAYLTDLVDQHKFEDFYFEPGALQGLLGKIKAGERGEFPLGERRDAQLTLAVGVDAMRVLASTEPPHGGEPLSLPSVEAALQDAGIERAQWHDKALQDLIKQPAVTDLLVASGVALQNGVDSQFVCLVEGVVMHQPKELGEGNVDHYDFMQFTVVEPGTLLMRREPAIEGIDGVDVFGTSLPAMPGKVSEWAKDMVGTTFDKSDDNLLIADTKGHPMVMANGVRLDNVLKLPSADRRTGHVEFDGTIQIATDVSGGVNLQATGDVYIKGTLEDATIQAGGDIVIDGGIISAEAQLGENSRSIRLEAGGNIHAKFVTGAHLHAEHDVVVKKYIGFSDTTANNQVLVGQAGGEGLIYGGTCSGRSGILANQLGSNSSATTIISAGNATSPTHDQAELNSALAALDEQSKKVQFLMENMQCEVPTSTGKTPSTTQSNETEKKPNLEVCNKLINTLTVLEQQQEEVRGSLADLQVQDDSSKGASIQATKSVRAGVVMQINGVQRNFKSRDAGGAFMLQKGAIVRVESVTTSSS